MHSKIVGLSIVYFCVIIVIAHFFTQPGYLWTQNTISELASQTHKYKWIMQAGFIGFGILLNMGMISKFIELKKIVLPDILIMLYGLAILVTGIFCERPIDSTIAYSLPEANIHSLFAMIAGVCLSVGILCYIFMTKSTSEKYFHVLFLILVMGISFTFLLAENGTIAIGKGLVQRGLYLTSLAWLFISQSR